MTLVFSTSDYDWKAVTAKTGASFIDLVNKSNMDIPFLTAENCEIQQIQLSFYDKARLICVRDTAWMESWEGYYFAVAGKRIFRLDGTSSVIYAMNGVFGLALTPKNIADYLIFFSAFILGEQGPFPIFVTEKKSKFFVSPKLVKKSKKNFVMEAYAFYDGWMFKCTYDIQTSDGVVEMMDDIAIASIAATNHFNPHDRLISTDA